MPNSFIEPYWEASLTTALASKRLPYLYLHLRRIHSARRQAWKPDYNRRDCVSTNLGSEGLASADRNNKATLLLTAPCPTIKSSAKDLFPRMVKLQYASKENSFLENTRSQPATIQGRSLFVFEYDVRE